MGAIVVAGARIVLSGSAAGVDAASRGERLQEARALAEARGAKVWLRPADVSRRNEVESMADVAIAALGTIDVLVNNAGDYKAARLVDITPEDFERVMQVNAYGAFHVMQLVLRHTQEHRRGKVVNIAPTAGKWGSMNQCAYNASKHALVGLRRCAALELAPHGIQVNAICPGFVLTDMFDEIRAHADILGVPFEKAIDGALARVPPACRPLGREGFSARAVRSRR